MFFFFPLLIWELGFTLSLDGVLMGVSIRKGVLISIG